MSDDESSDHEILRTLRALSRQTQDLPQALRGLLGQLGTDLPMFGVHAQYRTILEKIKPPSPPHVQMASLAELCELLSMTSEEVLTISGFNVEAYVPVLSTIIASPPSMDILLLACRSLAAILDIFSSRAVIQLAVSNNLVASLCDKMLNIEYMDVAEVALRMLERICSIESPETRAAVLQENGIVALLQFVDFFSVDVQRTAARTAALLCTDVSNETWFQLQMGLSLIQNLTRSFDADIVYQGCDCLKRLCETTCVREEPSRLVEIIDTGLLAHLIQLFSTYTDDRSPENMKPTTYPLLLRVFATLCRHHLALVEYPVVDKVLCSIFSAPNGSTKASLVLESLQFVDAVVKMSIERPDGATLVIPLISKLLPLMLDSFQWVDQGDVVGMYLTVMYDMTTFLSQNALQHDKPLCKFVASAFDRANAPDQEVALALYIVSLALQHEPSTFQPRFTRDGVVEALRVLSEKPILTVEVQQAKQILSTYFSTPGTTSVLEELIAIVGDIQADHFVDPLKQLAALLRRDSGVTTYELSTSNLVPALTKLFSSSPDATNAFREEIFPQYEASWLALFQVLHGVISSEVNKSYQEPTPLVSGTTSTVGMVELLAQHLKIKLNVAEDSTIPIDTVVLVEPLARVETMEEFVGEKVFGKKKDGEEGAEEEGQEKKLRAMYQGQLLPPSMSILETLVKRRPSTSETFSIQQIWEDTHELNFRIVEDDTKSDEEIKTRETTLPDEPSPLLRSCLDLFKLVYNMSLPVSTGVFVNDALSVQIKRNLTQPLIVAIQSFPKWCSMLMASYAFLLPLETKLHFLYASAFGPARAIQYLSKTLWKQEAVVDSNENRSRRAEAAALAAAVTRVAKIPRLKVRVARSKLLQSAIKLLAAYGGQKAIIEIEYLGEVGTGLGPTTEFFSLVSNEIQAQALSLWRHEGPTAPSALQKEIQDEDGATDDNADTSTTSTAHALPIRGYHRIAVVHCPSCAHISFPTCSEHNMLLTKSSDKSTKPSATTTPLCSECINLDVSPSEEWSLECRNASCESSTDVRWLWWIVSNDEVDYLSRAYPRTRSSVMHPVLQCAHCDTVNFPGTDAGIVTMEGDRMISRSGRRMYERDYRAVTKHVSALCEGTPLTQSNVVLTRKDVDFLVEMVPKSPEVLDCEIDGFGIDISFNSQVEAVYAPHGLFPKPLVHDSPQSQSVLPYFEFLGNLVAQALLDERLLDLPFALPFLRLVLGETLHVNVAMALQHIAVFDPAIGRSLTYLYENHANQEVIESMALTFVLVGEPSIPLCAGGADRAVTSENALEFVSRTVEMLLHTTVHDQVEAFRRGFAAIVPWNILTMLSAADWGLLLADSTRHLWPGGAVEIKTYMVCDHGYTQDSQAISWLVDILVELTPEEQRLFVQFVTGSHRLPLGGLAKLDPPLTVVRKLTTQDESQTNDAVLPSASTCTNYLKLPDYSSKDVMRARLLYVIHEGQLSFHLS
ncbi:hypothetical protein LEN26_014078 [Aphanomyces euteiches]|nr:hypothetical protein LEN26_014078 [Aphanomyces euteiches]